MKPNHSLQLSEIAGWQISTPPARTGSVIAALPALQRGAVWKVKQIEELWDSILRGFPIGAFVVAPPDEERGRQHYTLGINQDNLPKPTHLLLDGQQRATGIALGFDDIWHPDGSRDNAKSALWLDLGGAPSTRDVIYVFRAVTRAHPWGYSLTNPDDRLSEHQIRSALKTFQATNPEYRQSRPEKFPLTHTWPWDCEAPVPMPILMAALGEHRGDIAAAKEAAWRRIESLPLFANHSFPDQKKGHEDRAIYDGTAQLHRQCSNVSSAFLETDTPYAQRLKLIMQKLASTIDETTTYRVPLLHLDLNGDEATASIQDDRTHSSESTSVETEKKDPVELLFVRINSAGTPLSGEELIYSLLKSAWVDAPQFIESLKHKPALPSRIAMFCIRLVLARRQSLVAKVDGDKKSYPLPPAPSVDEFRRLVRNHNPAQPDFFETLQSFVLDDARMIFEEAWQFLTDNSNAKPYTLPPVLAVELAQRAPDVFLLLLRWVDKLRGMGFEVNSIDKKHHQRTLGFLTALAWFAADKTRAASVVWNFIQVEDDLERIKSLFCKVRFAEACCLDDRRRLRMIPLPSANELEIYCQKRVTGHKGCQDTISNADSNIWKNWNIYSSFMDKMTEEIREPFAQRLNFKLKINEDDDFDPSESTLQAWRHFINVLWQSHPVLLYAQRSWLRRGFPNFDPSLPEYMEDRNRPWDYDHIHPQRYLRSDQGNSMHGIPLVIWDWHRSIGNLRAWPLEANRADGDISPAIKLTDVSEEEKRYSMSSAEDKREASFVLNADWPWWRASVPEEGPRRYLKENGYHRERHALVMAIVKRFVALYREWYESLSIGDLQHK